MNSHFRSTGNTLLLMSLLIGCSPLPATYFALDRPSFFSGKEPRVLEGTCDIVRRAKTVRTRVRLQADSVGVVRGVILDELGVPLGQFISEGSRLEVSKWFPPLGPSYVKRVGLGLTAFMAGEILGENTSDTVMVTRLPGTKTVYLETQRGRLDSLFVGSRSRNLHGDVRSRSVFFKSDRGHTLFTFKPAR